MAFGRRYDLRISMDISKPYVSGWYTLPQTSDLVIWEQLWHISHTLHSSIKQKNSSI